MESISSSSRKITLSLFVAQSVSSAGMIAIGTINTIVGAELSGRTSLAGIPAAAYLTAGALTAFVWGNIMARIGWRAGLTAGFLLGVVGGWAAVVAIQGSSWSMLMAAMILIGAAFSAMKLSRFAAAEVHLPESRGKAIATVVMGGTVGAIVGPLMVSPSGRLAVAMGVDELGGAYMAMSALFMLAALVTFLSLKPEPAEIGKQIAEMVPEESVAGGHKRSILTILRQPAAGLAVIAMVLGQIVMVFLMAITSLHMRNNLHGLGNISLVISAHTFGMFAFSIISGRLADRFGRGPVIAFGAGTLVLASLIAPLSSRFIALAIALFLLGLGWNFCFVGGSALLADQLSPAERGPTQGVNDLLVGIVSALGSLGSGFAYASLGFSVMAYISTAIAVVLAGLVFLWVRSQTQIAVSETV